MTKLSFPKLLLVLLSLTPLSSGSTLHLVRRNPNLPTEDPFYSPPDGYEDKAPGTILRHRPPPYPLAAFGITPISLKSSHQILYRTTTASGDPTTTVTTLLVPYNANISRLVSYQDFMDSSSPDCQTSYALQQESSHGTLLSQCNTLYESGLLTRGYIVSIPDYEGRHAAFGSGLGAGYRTLDAIRAVLASSNFSGIASKGVDIGLWGYSGGSIPTEWAAELRNTYAPEVNILGAAMGGTIVNITSTIVTINKGDSAGFGPSGIIGITREFKELEDIVSEQLVPETKDEFLTAGKHCAAANAEIFKGKDIAAYFKNGFDWFEYDNVTSIIDKTGVMGLRGTPDIPLYFYKALADADGPIAGDDALVQKYCANGGRVEFARNSVGSHATESIMGAPGAMVFLDAVFERTYEGESCNIRNVKIMKPDWDTWGALSDAVLANIRVIFEAKLGKTKGVWGKIDHDVHKVGGWLSVFISGRH